MSEYSKQEAEPAAVKRPASEHEPPREVADAPDRLRTEGGSSESRTVAAEAVRDAGELRVYADGVDGALAAGKLAQEGAALGARKVTIVYPDAETLAALRHSLPSLSFGAAAVSLRAADDQLETAPLGLAAVGAPPDASVDLAVELLVRSEPDRLALAIAEARRDR